MIAQASAQSDVSRPISFGTTLNPQTVISESEKLAVSLSNPASSQWQAKGDQHRIYHFAETNTDEPYRLCVPTNWDGKSKLPLVMFLHGAGNTESSYLDQNNQQMVKLANDHRFLLVSPMGDNGAYGNFLRLSAPFGNEKAAADLMAQVTQASERTNELSEKDVINVLELVLHEYPIDSSAIFLTGHSMGSGGTWYIGGKYSRYWRALAPMSGPFVQETGYPWDSLHKILFFVTEGTLAPSLAASHALRDWMKTKGFNLKYKEVIADHPGMVPLVLPDVFNFFDSCRTIPVTAATKRIPVQSNWTTGLLINYRLHHSLQLTLSPQCNNSNAVISILDMFGRKHYTGVLSIVNDKAEITYIKLPSGAYRALIKSDRQNGDISFVVTD